jgi:predicted NBD/HSP70 family sugar kinase
MSKQPTALRTLSQYQILNTIRIAGSISRIEIAKIIGHSRATVTNITAKMIDSGLIFEKGVEDTSSPGRNRVKLAIKADAAYVAGIKVSAFRIGCVITNILAEVKSAVVMPVRTCERPVEFLADLIEEAICHCVKEAGLSLSQIAGIGIGVPGLVDSREGIAYWSPLYQHGNASLKDQIRKRFKIETYVDNDSNTLALSQLWAGKGKGVNNFVVVTIEDGLGMGVVIDGELYRGSTGFAGELGHFIAVPGGELCRCGKRGCYEAYVSNFGIVNSAKRLCETGTWQCEAPGELTYEEILDGARQGEKPLIDVFARAGEYLGLVVSGLVQIFNPTRVIVTGNGVQAGDLILGPMHRTIHDNASPNTFTGPDVIVHQWQDVDWSQGAACLVLQELYKSPFDRCIAAEKMQGVLNDAEA